MQVRDDICDGMNDKNKALGHCSTNTSRKCESETHCEITSISSMNCLAMELAKSGLSSILSLFIAMVRDDPDFSCNERTGK